MARTITREQSRLIDRRAIQELGIPGLVLMENAEGEFQVLSPLEFLAEFTQHIPPKGAHLIRYYGWYSNKARGMRRKAAAAAEQPGVVVEAAPVPIRGAPGTPGRLESDLGHAHETDSGDRPPLVS